MHLVSPLSLLFTLVGEIVDSHLIHSSVIVVVFLSINLDSLLALSLGNLLRHINRFKVHALFVVLVEIWSC